MTTTTRYDDLTALFINCTLKRSPELSHTGGLVEVSRDIMAKQGVTVDVIRAVDHDIATGVWPDMTEHDPAAGGCGLDRRGRPRTVLPRPRFRRPGKRLHQPQHHVHDLEPAAPGPAAERRRRIPAYGNQRSEWDAGCRFDFTNPEYR